jgi:hypothetical protein
MEGATPLTPGLLFASHANFLPIYPHVSYWQQVTDRVLQAQPVATGSLFVPKIRVSPPSTAPACVVDMFASNPASAPGLLA